MKLKLT